MEGDQEALSVRNLSYRYQEGPEVLRGLEFGLTPGDFLVVLGANGAGKSTLCYLLAGIVPNIYAGRRAGELRVSGLDPWDHRLAELAAHVGVVLQNPESQIFMPSVALEMSLGLANRGRPRAEIEERMQRALEIIGLAGFERRSTKALSGGQKQRLALGCAITALPKTLVLDEPTSQLDPIGSRELLEALSTLRREQHVTIVMTTHKTEEVAGLATHCLVLEDGQQAAFGGFDEVVRDVGLLERAGVQAPPAEHLRWRIESLGYKVPPGEPEAAVVTTLKAHGRPAVKTQERAQPGSAEEVLRLDGVGYTYPGMSERALRDVSLTVRHGEFVGIVGQNGSGKSTLLKLLSGLIRPSEGRYLLTGADTAPMRVAEIARRLGLVLQNPDYQLFNQSATEEVAFGLRNQKLPEAEVARRSQDALDEVGLSEFAELFPFRLGFGDRRKLAVAAVLALQPEVIVLDEPTTAQDYRGRYLLADLVRQLRERDGRTVLMVSHDIDLVAHYVDRLVVMRAGRITVDRPLREALAEEEELSRTYVSPPTATRIGARSGVFDGLVASEEELLSAFSQEVAQR